MEKNNQPENTPSFARKEDTASTASVPESPLADSPKLGEPKTEAPTYSETKEGGSEKSEEEKTDQVEEKPAEEAPPPPYSLEKALEDIDQFLSNFPVKNKDENDMPLEIPVFVEKFLDLVEDNIGKYDSKADPVKSKWCQVAEEDALFIEALDRISKLNAAVVEFKSDASHGSLINRAGGLQQRVMSYLEEEFRLLLGDSSKECDRGVGDGIAKLKDSESDRCNIREPESEDDDFPGYSEEVLYGLNRIAKEMISGGHESECCELYMIARREAFDECLINLGFGKISVDDVQKMQWDALENEIATWSKTFKQCATVYFQGERKLADKIFRDYPSIAGSLFSNLTRGVLIQLLNFAEAIAMSKRSAEKLFKFLDIYETLRDSLPAMDGLFEEESAGELKTETTTARCRIGEAAVCIFCDLENSIKSETGKTPVPGGAVHPLTRYTMNYLNYACDQYKDTLEQVFKEHSKIERAESSRRSQCDGQDNETQDQSRFSSQLMRVMDLLDANLEAQSKLYKDTSLSSIFLMNNGRYILQKIKGSAEIHQVMGDTLCRKRSSYLRNYHKGYQRETWNKLLGCLSHEGLQVNGKVVKPVLKERFKSFNAMFDEIHRTQSCWIVNDEQLQSELRVSISGVVIPAYRSFLGRFSQHLDAGRQTEKYVKFQAEDIENAIEELFEGNPTSMVRRKP